MNDNILYHALAPLSIPRSALPPFPLVSSASFGSAQSSPGREAAKRTLDGENRSGIIQSAGYGYDKDEDQKDYNRTGSGKFTHPLPVHQLWLIGGLIVRFGKDNLDIDSKGRLVG